MWANRSQHRHPNSTEKRIAFECIKVIHVSRHDLEEVAALPHFNRNEYLPKTKGLRFVEIKVLLADCKLNQILENMTKKQVTSE